MRAPATGCAVLLASALLTTQPASGPEDEVALGLVRPDGILTPVALFDGTTWVNPWPDADGERKPDRMLAAIPSWWRDRQRQVPQTWHVSEPSGRDVRAAVLTHVIFDEHCGSQIGLLTDLPRSAEDPHEKRLASTALGRISRTVDYSNAGARAREWSPLVDAAMREAEAGEQRAIRTFEEQSGLTSKLEPLAERRRITLKRADGYAAAGRRILYFEAERQYRRFIDETPGNQASVLFVSGWVLQDGQAAPIAIPALDVMTDVDYKQAITLRSLGIVQIGGDLLWAAQEHAYESEAFTLFRIAPAAIERVISTFIGGC